MKLYDIKAALQTAGSVTFQLPDGTAVPEHFHVTEVGIVTKHFIDCGGTVRTERKAAFQLWDANDYDHRLKPQKLLNIIALSEKTLGLENLEVEVEYQGTDTIGKYGIDFNGKDFLLTSTKTACLASKKCGAPEAKQKVRLSDLQTQTACCAPDSGCC
ncbi:MAG TPA: DUF6428 family protein [Flavobacteriales bacterium]|nr:DUF6428 family protein [Flavobacteriales bacterium]